MLFQRLRRSAVGKKHRRDEIFSILDYRNFLPTQNIRTSRKKPGKIKYCAK